MCHVFWQAWLTHLAAGYYCCCCIDLSFIWFGAAESDLLAPFLTTWKKKSRIPKEFLRKIRSLRESSCPYTRLFNTVTVSVVYMGLLCWNYASKMYCRWLIFDTSSSVFVSSFMQLIQKKTITSFPMSELNNKKDENFPNPSIQLLILIWVWVTGAVAFFLPSNLL